MPSLLTKKQSEEIFAVKRLEKGKIASKYNNKMREVVKVRGDSTE